MGKTTLVQSLPEAECLYLNCDSPRAEQSVADPEFFFQQVKRPIVIFDEIHQLRDPTLAIPIAGRSKNWNPSFWKLNQPWEQFYNPMPEAEAEKFFASVFPVMDRELEEFLKVQERRSPWRDCASDFGCEGVTAVLSHQAGQNPAPRIGRHHLLPDRLLRFE